MQQAPVIPIPKVVVPPLTTGGQMQPVVPNPILPVVPQTQTIAPVVPRPVVPTMTIPQPQTNAPVVPRPVVPTMTIPQPQPNVPVVPRPVVPTMTIPQPQTTAPTLPQPTVPVPKVMVPEVAKTPAPMTLMIQPQQTPVVATPVMPLKQPTGGILRQFGGATTGVVMPVGTTPLPVATPTVTIVEETGYSLLMKLLPVWNGTIEQAQQLAALQYQNGQYIIDVKRRDVLNEIIGMIRSNSFDDVIDFITDAPNAEYVLWDQESLDEGRIKVAREITIQQAEEVGVKGVGRCRYCPSTELVFAMKQLRSGDEPATIFVRCVMCNKQWRQ